jgi:Arc/MetJ family transcription regulator
MRTTLVLPDTLVAEAMEVSKISQKTELIVAALRTLIQKEKVQGIKDYFGVLDLGINSDELRQR